MPDFSVSSEYFISSQFSFGKIRVKAVNPDETVVLSHVIKSHDLKANISYLVVRTLTQ